MTDKFKDQDSMLPAATSDKKKISAKPAKSTQVIINPPEKVDGKRGFQERFQRALEKHTVVLEKKTELVLQSKATRSDFPQEVIEQVYKRGFKALPLNTELTREQYAMNRVNSFIAGGAAMVEDYDLLPITERIHTRIGMKGTGGGARPHIKREKSPYNGKMVYHVVDAKGIVKHSTGDEFEAKKHLASKYNSYMGESAPVTPLRHRAGPGMKDEYTSIRRPVPNGKKEVKESTLSPMKRFEGTKSLVKTYKADTPGEGKQSVAEAFPNPGSGSTGNSKEDKRIAAALRKKHIPTTPNDKKEQGVTEETLAELSQDTLTSYVKKVANDAMKHRMDPTKRSPEKASKSVTGFSKALKRLPAPKEPFFKEEVEQIDELSKDTLNSYISKAKKVELRSMRSILARGKGTDLEKRQAGLKAARERIKESAICSNCQADPCICDDSHGFVGEARMSASERFSRAWDKQRAKSDASLRRTPSSIPKKEEPKKEESK